MKITPEDLIYGWDPLKEDPRLGFKKLTNKEGILLKGIKQYLYDAEYISGFGSPATNGIIKLKNALKQKQDAIDLENDSWTKKKLEHDLWSRLKNVAVNIIDEVVVDSSLQMERDGYDLAGDIPSDLMSDMVEWTLEQLIKLGILPNDENILASIKNSYI
jgi:hypothetical protein